MAHLSLRDRLRAIVGTYRAQQRPRWNFLLPLTPINARRASLSDVYSAATRSPNKAVEGPGLRRVQSSFGVLL